MIRLWRHAGVGRGVGRWRAASFAAGWLSLCGALLSPLDTLGGHLFSAHMLQHELLMVVAAPLLVLSRPLAAWAWALPKPWRRPVGRFFSAGQWQGPWHAVTQPLAAWSLHATALWLWHVPLWFEAALRRNGVHALQHSSFLVAGLLLWWSVVDAAERRRHGHALLSLFTTMVHTGALGALMTLSPLVWYPSYIDTSWQLGLDPVQDQQLGGLLMWIPAGLTYVVAALALCAQMLALRHGGLAGRAGSVKTACANDAQECSAQALPR